MQPKVNQLKAGIILSYASRIVQVLIGLIYTPMMIRLLGQSEYGLYNIAAPVIAYLGVLNFGFGSAYMRFYSRYKVADDQEKIATLNGMFLILFSAMGVLAIIAGIILAFNVEQIFGPSLSSMELETARKLMLILVMNLGVSFPNIVFDTYIQANEQFIAQNVLTIILQITTPLVTLPLLLAGYGSVGMVIGTTIVNVIVETLTVIYAVKKIGMQFSFHTFDIELLKEMSVYSSYIFMNMIVDQVNNNVDKTILGRYQGAVSVAIYSIAAALNTYYTQISTTIANVFVPRIHRLVASKISDFELTQLLTRVGRVQFILLSFILSGFIFFGRPFIGIWAGENYYDSFAIALLLMIPITIPLIQNTGIEIQRAKNMHQFRSWIYLAMAIGNVIISFPLSIRYGGAGAAIGTALSMILGNGLAMNWYYHVKVGLDMNYFWKEIGKFLPAFLAPTAYGILINNTMDLYRISHLFVFGVIYVVVFIVSMWFLGLNDYEKTLIKNPFK